MKIHIIGLGLIGGSFALDLREAFPGAQITGTDQNPEHLRKAIDLGLVDRAAQAGDLSEADVVVLAIPVNAAAELAPGILDQAGAQSLVFDTGSTKAAICRSVKDHVRRANFLAAHPIAGTEYSGPGAALRNLYRGKTNIICEIEKTAPKVQDRALELFQALGMRLRYMDPLAHDRHIAYVSHLSHISSFMLGKTVLQKEKNERDIFDLAGSGFASTVRLAKSAPGMWAPIFQQNKQQVLESLRAYISNLRHFEKLLEEDKTSELLKEMEEINHIKNVLEEIK